MYISIKAHEFFLLFLNEYFSFSNGDFSFIVCKSVLTCLSVDSFSVTDIGVDCDVNDIVSN